MQNQNEVVKDDKVEECGNSSAECDPSFQQEEEESAKVPYVADKVSEMRSYQTLMKSASESTLSLVFWFQSSAGTSL